WTLVCVTLLAAPTAGGPARAAEPTQRFSGERTDVVAVEIPVQVTRDGQPVRGLTAADFEITDGRKKQDITGFEVIDLTLPPTAEAPAIPLAGSARRHFLMLFDLSNSEPKSIIKAREAAKKVVTKLTRSDLVAVATYSASKGSQLTLGFTTDRKQIDLAVDTLGRPELIDRSGDPLNLVIQSAGGENSGGSTIKSPGGRGAEAFLEDAIEDADRNKANDRRLQTQRLTAYTRSLSDLSKLMGNVKGRKYVVLLSEGFDSSLLVGTADAEETAKINQAVERGEFYNVDNDARFGSTQSGNDLEKMVEEFRRADCVIQAVDIGGLREAGARRANGQDGLFAMAQQTGGELFRNFNDLSDAMGKMLERTSVTYVLTFQPEVKRDGTYRKVKVELKNAPRGTKISARSGYYAPKPFDQVDPTSRMLDAADTIMGGREGGTLATSVLAAPFRGAGGKAYVPVLIEVDGPSLLAGTEGNVLPTEIYAYALGPDGSIGDYFGQTLGLDLAKVKGPLSQTGLKYFGHLELVPGSYSLRVLVRNGRTGTSGLSIVPIEVPEAGKVAVGPPLFPEPQGKWMIIREQPRGEQKNAAYPFMARQQAYVPAALPTLTAGQDAPLSLVAWNLPAGDVRLGVKVLGADGKPVPGGEVKLIGREPGAAGSGDVLLGSFKPTGLKAGGYHLEVQVAGADGANPVNATSVAFTVR
ncbi:MAG TPA: VWA domain-containing protein, partial [Thermoanaerobaculia bacterium]|nr:VWA domain-containing protein [Thermoanaerobaculia bacterium]